MVVQRVRSRVARAISMPRAEQMLRVRSRVVLFRVARGTIIVSRRAWHNYRFASRVAHLLFRVARGTIIVRVVQLLFRVARRTTLCVSYKFVFSPRFGFGHAPT